MSSTEPPIELQLTEEQQELIHKITGEHAQVLALTPDPGDPCSGSGSVLHFNWRISVDSGIPRQQWILRPVKRPPATDGGASA